MDENYEPLTIIDEDMDKGKEIISGVLLKIEVYRSIPFVDKIYYLMQREWNLLDSIEKLADNVYKYIKHTENHPHLLREADKIPMFLMAASATYLYNNVLMLETAANTLVGLLTPYPPSKVFVNEAIFNLLISVCQSEMDAVTKQPWPEPAEEDYPPDGIIGNTYHDLCLSKKIKCINDFKNKYYSESNSYLETTKTLIETISQENPDKARDSDILNLITSTSNLIYSATDLVKRVSDTIQKYVEEGCPP